jgi:HAMP domain-containing protein
MKSEYRGATLIPAQGPVTAERIERAKHTVARMMVKHNMPQLIVTIRFLEAEQDKLREQTAAMDYAKEILLKKGAT